MGTLTNYLAVALGGAAGAMLRFYLGGSALSRAAAPFPTATFVINVTGSFVLGFFLTMATERMNISPHVRLAVAVGFVGAYTTFSTFEYETARLVEDRDFVRALLNVLLSFAVGFAAVWLGIFAARRVEGAHAMTGTAYRRVRRQAETDDATPGAQLDNSDSARDEESGRRADQPVKMKEKR
ncbi:MAG: fluoride efflux transporter CrcB [Acidobacteria bacterium]|nr:fluoride efflux transporter CrcB [Acidobacteriota bacterium]